MTKAKNKNSFDEDRKNAPAELDWFFTIGLFLRLIGVLSMQFLGIENANQIQHFILCTTLGGLVALFLSRICAKQWCLQRIAGGMLAGKTLMDKILRQLSYFHFFIQGLSISGISSPNLPFWYSFILGPLSGLAYMLIRNFMIKMKLPDPVEVVATHLLPGWKQGAQF